MLKKYLKIHLFKFIFHQIIAADARPRVVAIQAVCAEMAQYLNAFGITESDKSGSKAGEVSGRLIFNLSIC